MPPLKDTWRRIRYGQPIVVVSGLPRSGTSMAMKMLEAGGLSIVQDGIRTADEDNPKGYYELERVKNLHKDKDRSWLRDTRGKAIKIISFLLRTLPPDNNYKILFMRRDLNEILASQAKMLDRRGEDNASEDQRMTDLYQRDLREALFIVKRRPHFDLLEINYRHALDHAADQAVEIQKFLEMPMDLDKMAGVVDRNLYRNRADKLAGSS